MQRYAILTVLMICLGFGSAQALHLDIGDYADAEAGMVIELPVTVGDMTGLDVRAFSIEVTYPAAYFTYAGVDFSTYDYGDWSIDENLIGPGTVRILGYGRPDPIVESGTLFHLKLYVRDTVEPESSYSLGFDDVVFNDGSISITTGTGSVTIAPLVCFDLSGNVWAKNTGCLECEYECANTGIGDISVSVYNTFCEPCLPGYLVDHQETDPDDGGYMFCIEEPGEYRVMIDGDRCFQGELGSIDELDGAIDGTDLWMLHQYLLGQGVYLSYCPTMTSCLPDVDLYPQQIAADTDGDEVLTPYDIHRLWQYMTAIMDDAVSGEELPDLCWEFLCDHSDITIEEIPGASEPVIFHAVLPGDINGSFGMASQPAKSINEILVAPRLDGVADTATGTVVVQNATGMRSVQFVMHYDPDVVIVTNTRLGEDARDCELFLVDDRPGRIIVTVLADWDGITDPACELLDFDVTLRNPDQTGQRSELTFTSHRIDMAVPDVRSGYVTNDVVSNEDLSMSDLKASYR